MHSEESQRNNMHQNNEFYISYTVMSILISLGVNKAQLCWACEHDTVTGYYFRLSVRPL